MTKKSTKKVVLKAETRKRLAEGKAVPLPTNAVGAVNTLLDLLPPKLLHVSPDTLKGGVYTVKVDKVEQTADGKNIITLKTLGDSPVPSEEEFARCVVTPEDQIIHVTHDKPVEVPVVNIHGKETTQYSAVLSCTGTVVPVIRHIWATNNRAEILKVLHSGAVWCLKCWEALESSTPASDTPASGTPSSRKSQMKRFVLERAEDVSGTSGTGVVAEGVVFSNGHVALSWLSPLATVTVSHSLDVLRRIHEHDGRTKVVFLEDQ